MNLKRTKIIAAIGIFILTFILHFAYDILPNSISAIFFPVNESIWEHQKLLFTSVIFYGIIDYIILQKFKIKYNNFFTSLFISAFTIVPIFLILYLPFFYKIGPKMILNFIIMFIAIIISQVISYYILKARDYNKLNIVSLILIKTSNLLLVHMKKNDTNLYQFFLYTLLFHLYYLVEIPL